MPKLDKHLGEGAAAVKLAEFAAAVLALADMPHSKLNRNWPVAVGGTGSCRDYLEAIAEPIPTTNGTTSS